ncbi:Clavaminate synthase-like protein [Annulohypoxylon bovei var. microspora]|nr:Clavaminate synthase-like protein [Annulohypoxylon bovei var. microspora]
MVSLSPTEQLFNLCAGAALEIQNECDAGISTADQFKEASLAGCGPALVDLLSRQARQISTYYQERQAVNTNLTEIPPEKQGLVLKRLDDIISISYSKFYAFLFKDLPACWRQLYTDASILKFCFNILRSPYIYDLTAEGTPSYQRQFGETCCELSELVKILDLALILSGAAGEKRGRRWINKALEFLRAVWIETISATDVSAPGPPTKRKKLDRGSDLISSSDEPKIRDMFSTAEPFIPPIKHPIKRVGALSMDAFQAYMDNPQDSKLGPKPLVIRGAVDHWPALTTNPWNKPSYLLSQTFDGQRLVPIEIGRSYVDEGWGQKIITFGEFLREYIDPSLAGTRSNLDDDIAPTSPQKRPIAYLAQHPLFTQLPTLRNDILIPDYCYTTPPSHPTDPGIDQPELDEPLLNAWFGPPGTITPLHNDPYHNILAQVVGRKYLRLYSPLSTESMQARGRENGVEMGNTSLMDIGVVEGWDAAPEDEGDGSTDEDLAKFREVPFLDCILEPGDALYIPIGWWHYVRGLSVSFSVSFWWN